LKNSRRTHVALILFTTMKPLMQKKIVIERERSRGLEISDRRNE